MATPFLGDIRILGFQFAPRGYAQCNGQLMSIAQNTALFSILGTTYGGNGTTTFALPDLRGRSPIHSGNGPGLTPITLGQVGGEAAHTLTTAELPAHTHQVVASADAASLALPTGNYFASGGQAVYNSTPDTVLDSTAAPAGGGSNLPHPNMPPYLVVNMCIALQGVFPSRN